MENKWSKQAVDNSNDQCIKNDNKAKIHDEGGRMALSNVHSRRAWRERTAASLCTVLYTFSENLEVELKHETDLPVL